MVIASAWSSDMLSVDVLLHAYRQTSAVLGWQQGLQPLEVTPLGRKWLAFRKSR